MGLVLHCNLKYRVWPHAHISRLRLKIFFTPKYLPKRPHGTKFQQNPRNGGSQRLHEIENLSVKGTFLGHCIEELATETIEKPSKVERSKDYAKNFFFLHNLLLCRNIKPLIKYLSMYYLQ